MTIDKISGHFAPIEGIRGLKEQNKVKPGSGESFSDVFTNAIKEVDQMQKSADQHIEEVTLGTGKVSPHEAVIALEKADMAFQLMNQVRTKIIRAYEEVMRTQV